MPAHDFLMAASGNSSPVYVDDVFSTYLYSGNGSPQNINNGIDLVGKGGLVWIKSRSGVLSHRQFDTIRGATKAICSNSPAQESSFSTPTDTLTAFGSSGFSLGADVTSNCVNQSTTTYTSWTFRRAPKFFDVVTYTGNGANRTIAHNLGIEPGMIIVKRLDGVTDWPVYHRSISNTTFLRINTYDTPVTDPRMWNSSTATASIFNIGSYSDVNAVGGTYVAYLFAHDPSADGLIQCGSYTTGAVNLGWEPQFLMVREISAMSNWEMADTARGLGGSSSNVIGRLFTNRSDVESQSSGDYSVSATGFNDNGNMIGTGIYLAIRRPNKPPTSGSQVYNAITRTGDGSSGTNVVGAGFPPDVAFIKQRSGNSAVVYDRLRGPGVVLALDQTASEGTFTPTINSFLQDGVAVTLPPSGSMVGATNSSGQPYINLFFRRAPGFFDMVCYDGVAATLALPHNLGVAPELAIHKIRAGATGWNWAVYCSPLGFSNNLSLNTTDAISSLGMYTSTPTTSTLYLPNGGIANGSGKTIVAYLFASLPGVSKVGSYTGNGTSQTISCGFTTGARFILIKRTDAAGDWYLWDSMRGIVAANDPHLSLNTTANEVATDDSVDPDASGFIVNQVAATNINVSGASYLFLAIA